MQFTTLTLAAVLALGCAVPGVAQTGAPGPVVRVTQPELPDAPTIKSSGTLSGQFVYSDGSPVAAVEVTVTPATGPALHTTTEVDGGYTFHLVPAGAFRLYATGEALETYTSEGTLPPSGSLNYPAVTLQIAPLVTTVSAITQEQAAEIEVKQEERQRILGIVPNFLVSYDDEPIPLTRTQKYRLSLRTLLDPANFGVSVLIAGGEQMTVRIRDSVTVLRATAVGSALPSGTARRTFC